MAVVVSYNGGAAIERTVRALQGQVDHVAIVDNGSASDSVAMLEILEQGEKVSVTRLVGNRGVGYALNVGIQLARELGYSWILTMDQDSVIDASMVRAYQLALIENPDMVSLSPRRSARAEVNAPVASVVGYAITSGNMVHMKVFDRIGLFDDELFIDCVDFDFSLRVRRAGYLIHRVSAATMEHALGEPVRIGNLLGKFYARHAPVRRYYMFRNYFYLVERYLLRFPLFIVKLGAAQIVLLMLMGFFDTSPLESYRAAARGVYDYLRRRKGPCPARAH